MKQDVNKSIRKVKLISRNILTVITDYSRFNLLYYFYVYPNSIMTFFQKSIYLTFLTTRKRLSIDQPLILNLSIYHFLASFAFLATAIWYFTWSNPVPPKEFRL
ncbi:hypothetical protein E3V85_02035 [Streptococcus pseudopneumoniae]|nr:hypothetical protein [Streptococcus pseudopneumoniae]TMR48168.1 hypothetical protein E3V85_02035 [Streptococcus pseudopneumoniae]TMR48189.1 hypothetical protein E3V84_01465 [Streptococcus pseudopneumoniae]TMR79892.1 hypothetical protein E3V35_06585 [Streptococcus pseudopneumoniae]